METMLTFFEELTLLMGMVNKAFPLGASGQTRTNSIYLSDRGNVTIRVWVTKDGSPRSFEAELSDDDDKHLSFDDIVEELKNFSDNDHSQLSFATVVEELHETL